MRLQLRTGRSGTTTDDDGTTGASFDDRPWADTGTDTDAATDLDTATDRDTVTDRDTEVVADVMDRVAALAPGAATSEALVVGAPDLLLTRPLRAYADDVREVSPDGLADLQDRGVDLVLCWHTLPSLHPAAAERALREMARVLRPGGVAVVRVADRRVGVQSLSQAVSQGVERLVHGSTTRGVPPVHPTVSATVHRIAYAAGLQVLAAEQLDATDPADAVGGWGYARYVLLKPADASVVPTPTRPRPADPVEPAAPPADAGVRGGGAHAAPAEADDELTPTPIRSWLRARPGRPVWVTAFALVVVQMSVRGVLMFRGTFYLDDLAFTGRAAHYPLWSSHLLTPYAGHLMPGSFVWVWVLTKIWPLSYAPVAIVNLALQLLLNVLVYRLLRDLFGSRPAIVVAYGVWLFTPITLPAYVWWAATLNQLPQQLALVMALRLHLRYLRTGRTRVGVYGALAVAAGLLFSEKTLLTVPFVAAFTVLYFHAGAPVGRTVSAARAHWRVWLAYALIAFPYAAYYVIHVPSQTRSGLTGQNFFDLADQSVGHALLPGLLGGPWRWQAIGYAGAIANPTDVAVGFALVVAILGIGTTITLRRGAVFGWALAAGYTLIDIVLLGTSRATFVGPAIGNEFRYFTDVALVIVLCALLAVVPLRADLRAEASGGQVQRVEPRDRAAGPLATLDQPTVREVREAIERLPAMVIAVVAVLLVAASGLYSAVRYDKYWSTNPFGDYLANVRGDLGAMKTHPLFADEQVPDRIAWRLLYPYDLASRLLAPLPDAPTFLAVGGVAVDQLAIVADDGHVSQATISGVHQRTGPDGRCGWHVGSDPVTVRMRTKTFGSTWFVRVAYIASAPSTTRVTAGLTSTDVPILAGLHSFYLLANGAIDTVRFSGLSGGASLCTSDVVVGQPGAVVGTRVP